MQNTATLNQSIIFFKKENDSCSIRFSSVADILNWINFSQIK